MNILDTIGRYLKPGGVNIPTTVPRQGGSKFSTSDLMALAGQPEERRPSMGSRIGRALLGTLVAGAIGPEAVQFGAGMADIYTRGKEKEQRERALKLLAATEAEQRRVAAEEKKAKAEEESSLKRQKNTREWLDLGGKAISAIGGYIAPKQKEWSPAVNARAKEIETLMPFKQKKLESETTRNLRGRVMAGSPSARARLGGGAEKPAKAISPAAPVTTDQGRVVPTDPAQKAVSYASKVAPVVAMIQKDLSLSGVNPQQLLKPLPQDPSRKGIDLYIDQIGKNIPPADRALVVRAILAGLGVDVPRVQEPMEPEQFGTMGEAARMLSDWATSPTKRTDIPSTRREMPR